MKEREGERTRERERIERASPCHLYLWSLLTMIAHAARLSTHDCYCYTEAYDEHTMCAYAHTQLKLY